MVMTTHMTPTKLLRQKENNREPRKKRRENAPPRMFWVLTLVFDLIRERNLDGTGQKLKGRESADSKLHRWCGKG
jgi:hypothetical protein